MYKKKLFLIIALSLVFGSCSETVETDKVELIITIGIIIDLKALDEEDLELIFEEAKIDEKFRKYYPCNYLYTIKKVETVH